MFQTAQLDPECTFQVGTLPSELQWDDREFAKAWKRHPAERHLVRIHGRWLRTPRWQQSFGANYSYSGSRNNALPIPQDWRPLLEWVQAQVDPRLNGLLLNWYEGRDDYIGAHHDSTHDLIVGTPIVTISFGETRTFRLTKGKGEARSLRDFAASHGTVFVLPWRTNKAWKHEVLKSAKYTGRRISTTFRAFRDGVLEPQQYFAPTLDFAASTESPADAVADEALAACI